LSAGIDDGRKGESEQVMREGSMEIAEIEQVVKPILARELGIDVASIGDDTNVDNMPLWDSVKHVDIVFAIQDAFALEFHPREIDEMYSYPEIMETLVRRLITAPGEVRDFSR
jgi:acyl carrier protein